MFRLFRFLLLLIIVAILGFGLYFWAMRISIFESFLSKQLNADVQIGSVNIGWNKLTLVNLQVKSGQLYSFQGTIQLEMGFLDFLRRPVHLQRIDICDSMMAIELYNGVGSDNNWSRLLTLLPARGSEKLIVDKLSIDNLRFKIKRPNGRNVSIPPISHLEFENLGRESPLTVPQVIRVIFQTILSKLHDKPFLGNVLDHVAPLPESVIKGSNVLDFYKEESRGVIAEGVDALKRKTREATDYLQELFSN